VAVVRRLVGALFVVWASVTALFLVFHVLPGNGADALLSGDRVASEQLREQTEQRLGLDRPLIVQYGKYWSGVLQGDLGTSFATGRPVSDMLLDAAPASLRLAFWALIVEVAIGIGLAVAVYRRRRLRALLSGWAVIAIAVPIFVVGYLFQIYLGVYPAQHDWPEWLQFPVQGIGANDWWLMFPAGEQWRYVLLPAVTLALVSSAILLRLTYAALREAVNAPHVAGARARGLSERLIFRRHVLRNALLPLLTFLAADLVALFGSAVLTETVFNWPGVGTVVSRAIERRDVPVVLGTSIVLAVAYVMINTLVDVVYRLIDPRLRHE
jgi:ABC-type dipeptide/oligopeptide/nickel transport system permease component